MQQGATPGTSKFKLGDGILITDGAPVKWTVIRCYWEEGSGMLYNLQEGTWVRPGIKERQLTKAEE